MPATLWRRRARAIGAGLRSRSARPSSFESVQRRWTSGFSPTSAPPKSRACPVEIGEQVCDDSYVSRTALIVDDHAGFRASARILLEDEGFDVVGEAADGRSGIDLARALAPDLVLLDIALPDVSGLDVADTLAGGDSLVVLTSSRQPVDFGARLRETEAAGFISKDDLSAETLAELLRGRT